MVLDDNFNYNSLNALILYGSLAALFALPFLSPIYQRWKTRKESSKRELDHFESEFLSGLMTNQSILAMNSPTLQDPGINQEFRTMIREELSLRHNCVVGGFRTLSAIQESRGRTPNGQVLEALANYQVAYQEAFGYRTDAV